jgi:peptidoglycan-N-acetylmuramic acid deacetylase
VQVAITFDTERADRPNLAVDGAQRLLDALGAKHVRATFFVQGLWALDEPDAVRRMARDGHVVGNHSYSHVAFKQLDDDEIAAELDRTHETLSDILGHEPTRWLRLPHHNGIDDARVLATVRRNRFTEVYTNCDPLDWDTETIRTPEDLCTTVLDCVRALDVAIVDLHSWPQVTIEAMPSLIDRIADTGAEFVTVDEVPEQLLRDLLPAVPGRWRRRVGRLGALRRRNRTSARAD